MVLGLKPMGKLATSKRKEKKTKYQTEPRSCMVLGLKPMGKLVTSKKKKKKNKVLDRTKVLRDPRTQIYGETSYGEV